MAKDVYYFSHDVNASNDPKIVAMESEFGVISYAWWWKLIEKLASSEDYRLPFKKYTFIALDKELGILNENERPLNENERPLNENEQGFFCSNKSFSFINSLIYDFELLECDDEYFWSPSLIRRQEERRSKFEKKQEQRRLAGIKSGEVRRKKEQNRTTVQRTSTVVEQNEQKERKGKDINNIERDTRAREDENPLSMFDDDGVKNKPIYELYMKSIGDVSPVIKERLDDLVESYGTERVIVAINTTADNGGNSIKYVETVTAGNLKKEVQKDFGTTKRNSSNRGSSRKDEQVDWQAEYERVHGKK
ncbi:Lin1244/Lin1753 domain-containing protein [uncultured Veillonella sp.]|uniref:Lin1244/Lin1753 domain-containing protein n=1 Tax=uncultured Veillonella sp. TaxID=159268 RepID=UPI002603867A|nr:Lin1244/Lin1753 domain-containing protein [uncultured Veillonella sp.]